jgi:hypothetical protein
MVVKHKYVDGCVYKKASEEKLRQLWLYRIRDCITMNVKDKKCNGCKNKFRIRSLEDIKMCKNNFDEFNFTPYPKCLVYPH